MSSRINRSHKIAAFLSSTLALVGLTSCSALPTEGPSASEVVARAEETADARQYLVVDLNQRVADILRGRGGATLQGSFGDHRPAPVQMIGVGDSLQVTIWEAAAGGLFSSPVVDRTSPGSHTAMIPEQVVARDGSITVPFAGRVKVVGLTPPQVEKRIVESLARKAIEPQALVSISRNISNSVTVSGEVTTGARIPLSPHGDRVLDVIASAGGIRAPVHETFVSITRNGATTTVPMQSLLTTPRENIFVRPGDTITLVRNPQSFTAFGATGRHAQVAFDAQGITLQEAIAKAGGLIDDQSDPSGVFLLRAEPVGFARRLAPYDQFEAGDRAVNVVYRIDLRSTNSYFLARDFAIFDKDIVYVSSAPANEWRKILSLIQLTTSPIQTGKAVAQ